MPYRFSELKPQLRPLAGGKGGVLARLWQEGYPVPDGLVLVPSDFERDKLRPEARRELVSQLTALRSARPEWAFAVRSSALEEDGAEASYAGAFDTILDVRTDAEIFDAIHAVRRSRHNLRAAVQSPARKGAAARSSHDMAVIVQRLVRPDFAGVLFTADPISGDLMKMPGNYVHNLAERLAAGESNAESFSFDRQSGRYQGPDELRKSARRLCRLALRLDSELGTTLDVEWAVSRGRVWILQARPIASMREFNPVSGEINSSLLGDFVWSNGNASEVHPEVQTVLTWSLFRLWGEGYGDWWSRYQAGGCIGGRSYFNITIQVAPFARLPGGLKTALRFVGDYWGRIPPGVTIPLAPFSRREVAFKVLPMVLVSPRRFKKLRRRIPEFVNRTPEWCREMRERITSTRDTRALAALWRDEIKPWFCFGSAMATAANVNERPRLEADLVRLAGEADADALLSNLGGTVYLASLGPLVGLSQLARGEIGREAYLERWGHRGPNEAELSRPQPREDPAWLDDQLAQFRAQPVDVDAMLQRRRAAFDAAWHRLEAAHPRSARSLSPRIATLARHSAQREAARSEITRVVGVVRAWALRAGKLTGIGEDVFGLRIDELLAVLEGDRSACRFLPARAETYARYRALPPYPSVISGRFDPFAWAADPHRRGDVFDAHGPVPPPAEGDVNGFPGAAGVVEGAVRRIERFEDAGLLRKGEVLVTTTTNVGWTLLFPRAAAIVTDVGAPMSHAAIVARELGIPAVVGCNDATMRLRTGDRVRVHGALGRVEILSRPPARATQRQ